MLTKCIREKIPVFFLGEPLNQIHQDTKSARLIAALHKMIKPLASIDVIFEQRERVYHRDIQPRENNV